MSREAGEDDWGVSDLPAPGDDNYDGFNDFDVGGADASKIGSGRVPVEIEGFYPFRIQATAKPSPYGTDKSGAVDMNKQRRPSILCACEVTLSSPGLSPAGSVLYHEIILGGKGPGAAIEDWARDSMLNFLVGIGILKNVGGQIVDPETGTTRIKASTLAARLNGLEFIGHVKRQKGNEKPGKPGEFFDDSYGFLYGRGAFQMNDPQVAHVPRIPGAGRQQPPASNPKPEPDKPAAAGGSSLPDDL